MKFTSAIVILLLFTGVACNKERASDRPHEHGDAIESGPNQQLYDQVMDVHDEVMPKMNDLYKAKTALSTQLKLPGTTDSQQEEIRQKIARIDSASEGMMAWMRQFEPPADSLGEESVRSYIQSELKKVERVREDILETLKAVE